MSDLSITAADVVPAAGANGFGQGTAGATITAGQWLYKDSTDSNQLKLADTDASQAAATCVGVALHAALDNQPIRYQTEGNLDCGGTTVVGTIYVLSGTAGGIAPAADLASSDWTTVLGIGTTSTNLLMSLKVSDVQVP